MGLKKSKSLRRIFIEYIVSLVGLIIVLILANYLLFTIAPIGVYPANYSERIIQRNYEELKNTSRITMDLLAPMSRFGVYSEDGDFIYGNFSVDNSEEIWNKYSEGKMIIGLSNYITSIEREDGILIISYPLTAQFTSEKLRRFFPNAEAAIMISFFIQLIIITVLWSNRFAKKVNNELKDLLIAMGKVEGQDLDFNVGTSNIKEIDTVLQGIDKMKNSLRIALEKQWLLEQQKKEQISALAHDIKTPLTIVKGNAGLLKETDMTEEQKNYCNYIEESSIQMEEYLRNLQTITKEEIDNCELDEIVDIRGLIDNFKNQGEALGKIKDIKMIWSIDIEEDLYIKGNENELNRALMNIITNAIDFSPTDSTITVNGNIDNSQMIIQVIDQGKGFSKKMLKHGKEQFFMGDESRLKSGHSGLGLYIANNIIAKHNGVLILSNDINGGGLVMVKIPI